MAFDFKKEYKEFYMPKNKPSILTVPPMNYIAVRGHGDPNREGSEYKQAIGLLYGIAFTIKMSKKGAASGRTDIPLRMRELYGQGCKCSSEYPRGGAQAPDDSIKEEQ